MRRSLPASTCPTRPAGCTPAAAAASPYDATLTAPITRPQAAPSPATPAASQAAVAYTTSTCPAGAQAAPAACCSAALPT
jgi:hypothetical protein